MAKKTQKRTGRGRVAEAPVTVTPIDQQAVEGTETPVPEQSAEIAEPTEVAETPVSEAIAKPPQTEPVLEVAEAAAEDSPAAETLPEADAAKTEAPTEAPAQEIPAARTRKAAGLKKVSALDAAVQVLATKEAPMTAPELIEAMATAGLWESPSGKTPAATLYAAMLREITTKGAQSRFSRPEKGKFALVAK